MMKLNFSYLYDIGKHIVSCSIILLLCCGFSKLNAQNVSVKGAIQDETGAGLPGASVVIKGTAKGTVTDNDGGFALEAPKGATLLISYVGYDNQEVIVNDNTPSVFGSIRAKPCLKSSLSATAHRTKKM